MMQVLQPPGWEKPKGYANGVAARGTTVFTGGQIGWNAQQQFESDDFIDQTKQTLLNVRAVLEAGGAKPEHLVRLEDADVRLTLDVGVGDLDEVGVGRPLL